MSFGSAAARRGRRLPAVDPCPCGSGQDFSACCGPILDCAPARSSETLMRSRYTAFALGDVDHLLSSWHPTTRPETLELEDTWEWRRLDIVRAQDQGTHGIVEFRAQWHDATAHTAGELHEVSRFRQAAGRWFYVDGDAE
nr:YchJ family metal-binding protein [uncultured Microbacterium sp.]